MFVTCSNLRVWWLKKVEHLQKFTDLVIKLKEINFLRDEVSNLVKTLTSHSTFSTSFLACQTELRVETANLTQIAPDQLHRYLGSETSIACIWLVHDKEKWMLCSTCSKLRKRVKSKVDARISWYPGTQKFANLPRSYKKFYKNVLQDLRRLTNPFVLGSTFSRCTFQRQFHNRKHLLVSSSYPKVCVNWKQAVVPSFNFFSTKICLVCKVLQAFQVKIWFFYLQVRLTVSQP